MQLRHQNFRLADIPPAHRCLPCLDSDDAAKRACALRHLMAEGLVQAASQETDRQQ